MSDPGEVSDPFDKSHLSCEYRLGRMNGFSSPPRGRIDIVPIFPHNSDLYIRTIPQFRCDPEGENPRAPSRRMGTSVDALDLE